jgi:hypothetical protein
MEAISRHGRACCQVAATRSEHREELGGRRHPEPDGGSTERGAFPDRDDTELAFWISGNDVACGVFGSVCQQLGERGSGQHALGPGVDLLDGRLFDALLDVGVHRGAEAPPQ